MNVQNVLGRDGSARPTLPMGELATDRDRLNLTRAFAVVVMACHRYTGRKSSNFGSKDVVRMLFTSIRCLSSRDLRRLITAAAVVLLPAHCCAMVHFQCAQAETVSSRPASEQVLSICRVGGEAQQAAAVLALGQCSLDNCALLPEELKALKEECTADRKVSAVSRPRPGCPIEQVAASTEHSWNADPTTS